MRNNILRNHMRALLNGWKICFKHIYEWVRYVFQMNAWIDDEV
jgi:hypothetical protein